MSDTERLAELNKLGSSHFWGNSAPLCPHCGAAFDIERNDAYDLYSDDDMMGLHEPGYGWDD